MPFLPTAEIESKSQGRLKKIKNKKNKSKKSFVNSFLLIKMALKERKKNQGKRRHFDWWIPF